MAYPVGINPYTGLPYNQTSPYFALAKQATANAAPVQPMVPTAESTNPSIGAPNLQGLINHMHRSNQPLPTAPRQPEMPDRSPLFDKMLAAMQKMYPPKENTPIIENTPYYRGPMDPGAGNTPYMSPGSQVNAMRGDRTPQAIYPGVVTPPAVGPTMNTSDYYLNSYFDV